MRKTLLAAVLALAALAVPASAGAAVFGLNVNQFDELPNAQATGIQVARIFQAYPASAPTSPTEDEFAATLDKVVAGYAAAGIRPIIDVTGQSAPPASVANYASYVKSIVDRYGDKLFAIEVWNEPDEAIWWGKSGGDPGLYAQLLRATYAAVGGRIPVVSGGLTGNNYKFMDAVYQALGGTSAGAFDAVGAHTDTACSIVGPDSFYRNPDGQISEFSFLGIRSLHDTMAKYGDAAKKIWLTEIGWSTTSHICDTGAFANQKAGGVTEADQSRFLSQSYNCLLSYDFVQYALWFNLRDPAGSADLSPLRYGLERTDGTPKPAMDAFKAAVAGQNPLAGQPCGDFDPPAITVTTPGEGGVFYDILPISVSAADPSGVGRISLAADGKEIRNFTNKTSNPLEFPKSLVGNMLKKQAWQGAKKLAYGKHTLTVTALDGNGNTATKTVNITKVNVNTLKLKTKFKPLKLSGKGKTRKLKVQVTGPTNSLIEFRAVHKVRVVVQTKSKGKWKTVSKYTKPAKSAFTVTIKLKRKGSYRVQAIFDKKAPFLASKTSWKSFKY